MSPDSDPRGAAAGGTGGIVVPPVPSGGAGGTPYDPMPTGSAPAGIGGLDDSSWTDPVGAGAGPWYPGGAGGLGQ